MRCKSALHECCEYIKLYIDSTFVIILINVLCSRKIVWDLKDKDP